MLWKVQPPLDALAAMGEGTLVETLGIQFVEIGPRHLVGRIPVDRRTVQPYGVLHGGAAAALAETLGSVASALVVGLDRKVVGIQLTANFVRATRSGWVTGTCTPVHVGRSTHVWDIRMTDERGQIVSVARATVAVLDAGSAPP